MSGCTPMRNENEDTDFHGLRSQIFMNYPRSSAFVRVLFTEQSFAGKLFDCRQSEDWGHLLLQALRG